MHACRCSRREHRTRKKSSAPSCTQVPYACMRLNVERKRTEVCVSVCVRKREEVVQWLMHNDNKKGHNIITYLPYLPQVKVVYTRTYLQQAQCDNNRNCVYLRYDCYILSMLSMLNDDNNNKSLRSTTAILHLLRARWEILSLSDTYLHLSIQQPQKWGSDSKYPKRAIECAK